MQDTSGVDAQIASAAIHAGMACYPLWPLAVVHSAAQSAAPNGAARTWRGATPQAEGLVRARGPACFHTLPPPSRGRSRSISPSREGHRAPVAAVPCGDQPSAHRQGGSGGGAPARPLPRQRRVELGVRRGAQADRGAAPATAVIADTHQESWLSRTAYQKGRHAGPRSRLVVD